MRNLTAFDLPRPPAPAPTLAPAHLLRPCGSIIAINPRDVPPLTIPRDHLSATLHPCFHSIKLQLHSIHPDPLSPPKDLREYAIRCLRHNRMGRLFLFFVNPLPTPTRHGLCFALTAPPSLIPADHASSRIKVAA